LEKRNIEKAMASSNLNGAQSFNYKRPVEKAKPRLLFLAHPFPPAHSIGAVRTRNIAKHLSRLGWEITVVTPDPNSWARLDRGFPSENNHGLQDVRSIYTGHSWRCLNPTALRCWNDGLGKLCGGAARIVARRLRIDSGIGWIKPATKACSLLAPNDFDLILATGRPFAAFDLAGRLAKKFGRPYVLDYRDPWTCPSPSQWPDRIARREEMLLKGAAAVITVSPIWANAMRDRFQLENKIHVITNGYDPEETSRVAPHQFDHFAIVYAGRFYPPRRVVTPLMAALRTLKSHNTKWYFHYYGGHASHVAEEAAKYGLSDRIVQHGTVPRQECLSAIRGASVSLVLNPVNPEPNPRDVGWIPAKLFELVGLRAPLLFIGATEGDAAKIVKQTGEGGVFSAQNIDGIASFLSGLMDNKAISVSGCAAYSWPNLATKLDRVLRASGGIPSPVKFSVGVTDDNTEAAFCDDESYE
jgi:glycosyltransferase involved in cell wall biosynthesis